VRYSFDDLGSYSGVG